MGYNVWWWHAPGGNYNAQRGMHKMLRSYGEQRVALLAVQECEGGWGTLKRLAGGNSLDYLRLIRRSKALCGSYDPAVFRLLAEGEVHDIVRDRHLQWARLQVKRT